MLVIVHSVPMSCGCLVHNPRLALLPDELLFVLTLLEPLTIS